MPFITGYAIRRDKTSTDGKKETKHCYPCAALLEKEDMKKDGMWTGYVKFDDNTKKPVQIQNWTGNMSFIVTRYSEGEHNWRKKRFDVWFRGPDGAVWHGTHIESDVSELIHCRRTKLRSAA